MRRRQPVPLIRLLMLSPIGLLIACGDLLPVPVDRQPDGRLKTPCEVPEPPPPKGKRNYNDGLLGWQRAVQWALCERDRADTLVKFIDGKSD